LLGIELKPIIVEKEKEEFEGGGIDTLSNIPPNASLRDLSKIERDEEGVPVVEKITKEESYSKSERDEMLDILAKLQKKEREVGLDENEKMWYSVYQTLVRRSSLKLSNLKRK
ncbi:MAG: hypothetical protein WC942_08795, partial [Clostridia bacterium]